MRKQNDPISPAPKHERRLINSTIRSAKYKRPNALKHGVFSDVVLIPGEDSGEYKQLLAELMDEWNPAGPTLRGEVIELANLMWKRRRLKKFIQTKLIAGTHDPRNPSFDETWGDCMFIRYLQSEPETCFERASSCLRADRINYLKQKFPRSNYQSTSEWVEALTREIMSAFAAAKPEFEAPELGDSADDELREAADELREAIGQWKANCQVAGTIMHAHEPLEYELKETERLNAMIVKQTRHCAQLKAWEEAEEARRKT